MVKYFPIQCSPNSEIAFLLGQLRTFARFLWYKQHVDEFDYGASMKLYWQGRIDVKTDINLYFI